MSRNKPSNKPHSNDTVVIKFKQSGSLHAARWTGRRWRVGSYEYKDKSIECWWPLPTEEQLDALHDYAVHGHKGETVGRMGPFFPGHEELMEDFGNRYGMLGEND